MATQDLICPSPSRLVSAPPKSPIGKSTFLFCCFLHILKFLYYLCNISLVCWSCPLSLPPSISVYWIVVPEASLKDTHCEFLSCMNHIWSLQLCSQCSNTNASIKSCMACFLYLFFIYKKRVSILLCIIICFTFGKVDTSSRKGWPVVWWGRNGFFWIQMFASHILESLWALAFVFVGRFLAV